MASSTVEARIIHLEDILNYFIEDPKLLKPRLVHLFKTRQDPPQQFSMDVPSSLKYQVQLYLELVPGSSEDSNELYRGHKQMTKYIQEHHHKVDIALRLAKKNAEHMRVLNEVSIRHDVNLVEGPEKLSPKTLYVLLAAMDEYTQVVHSSYLIKSKE